MHISPWLPAHTSLTLAFIQFFAVSLTLAGVEREVQPASVRTAEVPGAPDHRWERSQFGTVLRCWSPSP